MKKTTRNSLIRFAYIGATIVIILLIGALDPNFKNLGDVLKIINPLWIFGGIACMAVYWITDAWLLHHITGYMYGKKVRFRTSFKVGMIGLYYSALTPSSSGGQPAQVVYMKREGIPVGTSTSIVVIKFIAYALTSVVYFAISIIAMGGYYYETFPGIFWFSVLGCAVFGAAIVIVVLTIVKRNWIINLCKKIIAGLHKIKIIKDTQKAEESMTGTINDYAEAAIYIKDNKGKAVVSFLISMLNIGLLFAITYFIYRSFGLSETGFFTMMALQSLLYIAVAYVPIPGSAGASEGGFYIIFTTFFSKNLVFMAVLLWRLMTYYIILIVGSLIIVFDELIIIRKRRAAGEDVKLSDIKAENMAAMEKAKDREEL